MVKVKQRRFHFFLYLKWLIYFASLIFLFWVGTQLKNQLQTRKITNFHHIQVVSNGQHIAEADIRSVVLNNLNGGFFTVPLDRLKEQLLLVPWVADVSIRRVWPDKLMIQIFEQVPWARWGADAIVNSNNQVVKVPVNTIPADLPQLTGVESSENAVIEAYEWMSKLLESINLKIVNLSVDSRYSWTLVMSNHVRVNLGKENIKERFERFVHLYPQLIAIANNQKLLDYVDLRYPNGFAVMWKPATLTPAPTSIH